jgi:mannosyltransferase OCH1-like enzyme
MQAHHSVEIPRRIHFIWMGSPLPDWAEYNLIDWRKHHSDWDITIWGESNLPPLLNHEAFLTSKNYAEASDVLRYELLYRYGGVYCDIDSTCFKCLEPLLQLNQPLVSDNGDGFISTGTLIFPPHHPFLAAVIEGLFHTHPTRETLGNSERTGPRFLSEMYLRHRSANLPVPVVLPPHHFFSIRFNSKKNAKPHPKAYLIHQFAASWLPPEKQRLPVVPS